MSLRFTYPARSTLSATRICNAGETLFDKDQFSFCKRRAFCRVADSVALSGSSATWPRVTALHVAPPLKGANCNAGPATHSVTSAALSSSAATGQAKRGTINSTPRLKATPWRSGLASWRRSSNSGPASCTISTTNWRWRGWPKLHGPAPRSRASANRSRLNACRMPHHERFAHRPAMELKIALGNTRGSRHRRPTLNAPLLAAIVAKTGGVSGLCRMGGPKAHRWRCAGLRLRAGGRGGLGRQRPSCGFRKVVALETGDQDLRPAQGRSARMCDPALQA
jgi:hypothetical protein